MRPGSKSPGNSSSPPRSDGCPFSWAARHRLPTSRRKTTPPCEFPRCGALLEDAATSVLHPVPGYGRLLAETIPRSGLAASERFEDWKGKEEPPEGGTPNKAFFLAGLLNGYRCEAPCFEMRWFATFTQNRNTPLRWRMIGSGTLPGIPCPKELSCDLAWIRPGDRFEFLQPACETIGQVQIAELIR